MTMRPRNAAPVLLVIVAACLGDPVGPGIITIAIEGAAVDTVWVGAPGEALPSEIRLRVTDDAGRPLPGASVTWEAEGRNAHVLAPTSQSNSAGLATAGWLLGTDAAEEQRLHVSVRTSGHESDVVIRARAVPHVVSQIRVAIDTPAVVRLGDTLPVAVNAIDPYGNVFPAPDVMLSVTDSGLGAVAGQTFIGGPYRGPTSIRVASHGVAAMLPVRVTQYVAAIVPVSDTLRFSALGAQQLVAYVVRDDRGRVVADTTATISVADSSVAQLAGEYVRAVAPGLTTLTLTLAPAATTIPVGVQQRVAALSLGRDSIVSDAVGDTVSVHFAARDGLGSPVSDPAVAFSSTDTGVVSITEEGLARTQGNGAALIIAQSPDGPADTAVVSVAQRVTDMTLGRDSLVFESLQAVQGVEASVVDRLGVHVSTAQVSYGVEDTTIATVDQAGQVRALANGVTRLLVSSDGVTAAADVRVAQRPVRVAISTDTIHFDALGDTQTVVAVALDSLGSPVVGTIANVLSADLGIVTTQDSVTLRAVGNGTTSATVVVAGVAGQVVAIVQQVATALTAELTFDKPIVTLPVGASIPITCQSFDRNGFAIVTSPEVAPSLGGRWSGNTCADIQLQRSGFDTLHISAGTAHKSLPVILAVRPMVTAAFGDSLVADTLPAKTGPWAPTVRRNSHGEVEVYFAAYRIVPDSNTQGAADLHRLVSQDGKTFRYDGVVLQHDSVPCSLQGSGIENVDIVPRSDGPGWRMYYAAGSFGCYGWQVFSAVSLDERTWTKEAGVRLSNGSSPPPAPPNTAFWPAGEGMVTERLPSGEWRMIVSTYEHQQPPEEKFQITEWRSSNQLDWTYVRTAFSTRELPPEGQRSVYSPTIREFAPGLWRMVVTADDLNVPGGRSRLWSAVSTDKESWQFEGELLGAPGINYFYASLSGELLVTIRGNHLATRRLYTATVQMP